MKAVIVECSNGAAVALCDDGTFRKLKNNGYSIGQQLLIQQKMSPNRVMQQLSICASLALILLSFIGIGSYSYVKPYSYVSLDINPSIEFALNRYDKVISVFGINDKGQQVVSSIESDIKNQDLTTALGVTIRQLEKEKYITEEVDNHVIVSVCSANDIKAHSIASCVDTFSAEEFQVCSIDTVTVSKEIKDNADSLGITPGKLALIHAVAETTSDYDFDVSEWTDKTVSELETTIQQASIQSPDSDKGPMAVTVIDSKYLSSVLDDSTANDSDSTATASASKAETDKGSASTDKQTNTTKDTTTGPSTDAYVSTQKPNQTGNTAPAADSSASGTSIDKGDKTDPAASSGNPTDADAASNGSTATVADDSNVTGQDPSEKDPGKDSGNNSDNSSKEPVSSTPAGGEDQGLTEENSSKKDPYPGSETNVDTDLTDDISDPSVSDEETVNDKETNHTDDDAKKDKTDKDVSEFTEESAGFKDAAPSFDESDSLNE